MKANELMIGDYARVSRDGLCIKKGSVVVIRGIDADDKLIGMRLVGGAHCHPLDEEQFDGGVWCEYLEPIPLTAEILEKNGFFYPQKCAWMKLDNPYRELYACEHTDGTWWLYSSGDCDKDENFAEIRYVHELQHALRLYGIERNIVV